jgi:hypothetical protein
VTPHETPDEIINACDKPATMAACSAVVDKVHELVSGGHSDAWFWSQGVAMRNGQPHELPTDVVGIARAVAWERTITEHFERVFVLDHQLADYATKNDSWRTSAEGQTFFVDRTIRRAVAIDDAGYAFRRLLGKFVERFDSVVVRRGMGPDQAPRVAVAHETPNDIANECAAVGAKAACRSMIQQLKKVIGAHPDDWFGEHAVWLRTRRPSSPSDDVRAARAIAWEPSVTEKIERVEAINRDLEDFEANKEAGWKASAAGQAYFADRMGCNVLAVREAGREFRRLLTEFVERLERIAA